MRGSGCRPGALGWLSTPQGGCRVTGPPPRPPRQPPQKIAQPLLEGLQRAPGRRGLTHSPPPKLCGVTLGVERGAQGGRHGEGGHGGPLQNLFGSVRGPRIAAGIAWPGARGRAARGWEPSPGTSVGPPTPQRAPLGAPRTPNPTGWGASGPGGFGERHVPSPTGHEELCDGSGVLKKWGIWLFLFFSNFFWLWGARGPPPRGERASGAGASAGPRASPCR